MFVSGEESSPTTGKIISFYLVGESMSEMETGLSDRLITALECNPYLSRKNLRFETNAGKVTLRGVVGSYYHKQMAQEALRRVEGVSHIQNDLEVTWG